MKSFIVLNIVLLHEREETNLHVKIHVFDVFYSEFRQIADVTMDSEDYVLWALKFDKMRIRKYVFANGDYKGVIF